MRYSLALVENGGKVGRRKKIGSLIRLPDDRLGVFVGYCPNEQCSGKICMGFTEARQFSEKYKKHKSKMHSRILLNLINRLEKYA